MSRDRLAAMRAQRSAERSRGAGGSGDGNEDRYGSAPSGRYAMTSSRAASRYSRLTYATLRQSGMEGTIQATTATTLGHRNGIPLEGSPTTFHRLDLLATTPTQPTTLGRAPTATAVDRTLRRRHHSRMALLRKKKMRRLEGSERGTRGDGDLHRQLRCMTWSSQRTMASRLRQCHPSLSLLRNSSIAPRHREASRST